MPIQEIRAGRLLVEFTDAGDRQGHAVFAVDGSERVCLLTSVEGSGEEPWPASPPLQDLHIESRGDERCVALLVGRAGGSHWSMSVEADPLAEWLTFDIACRLRTMPQWLGSTYQATAAARMLGGELRIAGGATLRLLDDAAVRHAPLEIAGDIVRLAPAGWSGDWPKTPSRTIRWRYAIQPAPDTVRTL